MKKMFGSKFFLLIVVTVITLFPISGGFSVAEATHYCDYSGFRYCYCDDSFGLCDYWPYFDSANRQWLWTSRDKTISYKIRVNSNSTIDVWDGYTGAYLATLPAQLGYTSYQEQAVGYVESMSLSALYEGQWIGGYLHHVYNHAGLVSCSPGQWNVYQTTIYGWMTSECAW